jgi:hypothetical protein
MNDRAKLRLFALEASAELGKRIAQALNVSLAPHESCAGCG